MTVEPASPRPRGTPPPGLPRWWLILMLVVVVNYVFLQNLSIGRSDEAVIPYTTFKSEVEAGNVVTVTAVGDTIVGRLERGIPSAPPPPSTDGPNVPSSGEAVAVTTTFRTHLPSFAEPGLEAMLEAKGVVIDAQEPTNAWAFNLLVAFGPILILVGAFLWISRRAASAAGAGLFGFGKSGARRYNQTETTATFEDVAGIDDAKNELVEIVEFLKDPEKYGRLGGTMPKGVLLVGAPGTGKTLMARAIAGEAGVPFFSLSASEFIEMIVGVGAARVRDLFAEARAAAPSIIFVDELDSIGRARASGPAFGGHDEREQTLNQILTEMDGFDPGEAIVVIAATNRPDVLDAALLRPGRFDRRVIVQHPDRAGRAAILAVHTRTVPLNADVSLDRLAAETPGLVGADLRNLVNEAALLGARSGAETVGAAHFAEAIQKITLGPVRHMLLNAADRERTAYHEAGHALLALLMPSSDPVHRVSIVPRGIALGATTQHPTMDRTNYGEDYLRTRITGALGGRAAEHLTYGVVTSGAESDLQHVTAIARRMVMRWGMSEKLGPISFVATPTEDLPPAFQQQPYSASTSKLIDDEVRRIVEECQDVADRLLLDNRGHLASLANALLEHESLTGQEIAIAAGLSLRDLDDTPARGGDVSGEPIQTSHST